MALFDEPAPLTVQRVKRQRWHWRDSTGKRRWSYSDRKPEFSHFVRIISIRTCLPNWRWPNGKDHAANLDRFVQFFPEVAEGAAKVGVVLRGDAGQSGWGEPCTLIQAWGSGRCVDAFCREWGRHLPRFLPLMVMATGMRLYTPPYEQIRHGPQEGDWAERHDLVEEFFPFVLKPVGYPASLSTRFDTEVGEPVFVARDVLRFRTPTAVAYARLLLE